MNIIHVVGGRLSGGAARGAYWLHLGLRELGVDSTMVSQEANSGDENLISISDKRAKIKRVICAELDNLALRYYQGRKAGNFSTGFFGTNITQLQAYKEADIVHLHWINNGMLSMLGIGKIRKPIIWTLRDMWPMTGGCHYAMDCQRYSIGCGKCPHLASTEHYDLSRGIAWMKEKCFRKGFRKNIELVGVSNWLTDAVGHSQLFKDLNRRTIHNGIDLKEFRVLDKKLARSILGINTEKKVILTGAYSLRAAWKGFGKFVEMINHLASDEFYFLFFGKVDKNAIENLELRYRNFGFIQDNLCLNLIYSASDVFVSTSLMEAFGKTLAESLACGTPVVCFNATGPKDIIDHKINGYKANPYEAKDLSMGIRWVLGDTERHDMLCRQARMKAIEKFDITKIARQYRDLYEEMINQ